MPQPVQENQSPHERTWRGVFFYLSALMGALALVDLDAGRFAHALGDAGVACLMLSLMNRFPFVQTLVRASERARSPEEVQREMDKLRAAKPWVERVAAAGWLMLVASLILRAAGAG